MPIGTVSRLVELLPPLQCSMHMLALKNFIQYGVAWQGGTNDVEYMQTRAARVLMLSLADQIGARNPASGVKTGRPGLTGFTYEKSTVASVLARLIKMGILTRQRASRRGGRHEDFATTLIAPLLIEHALKWQRACLQLKKAGKRGANAKPDKVALQIPLISTVPAGESMPARLAAGERPDIGPISVQKLDTISIFTPPLPETAIDQQHDRQALALPSPLILLTPHAVGGRDSSSSGRPYFCTDDVFEFRKFSSWLLTVNKSDSLTSIQLMQPSRRGRLEVFSGKTSGTGQRDSGLTSINPEKIFKLAFARSKEPFQKYGEGEQVFLGPRIGSRVLLLDDLKDDKPVISDTPFVILQTSSGNYQHFYACDRGLTTDERGDMQAELARKFGADAGATGGGQPHRCPGSVNYKPGRGLFVTRLIHLSLEGRAIPFFLSQSLDAAQEAGARKTTTSKDKHDPVLSEMSQSEADWAWVKNNRSLGFEALVARLAARSAARGKHPGYASRTVQKALST